MANDVTTQLSDGQLVQHALAGSQAAFHDIVNRYQVPAQVLAMRLLSDRALAEDLTQEAFTRAFGRLSTFDRQRRFSSWFFQIVRNLAIDYLRVRRPICVPLESLEIHHADDCALVARGPSPHQEAELASLLIAVNTALARIKPQYRKVVLMRYQEELPLREIALALDVREGTVAVYLCRARRELALFLESRTKDPRRSLRVGLGASRACAD